MPNYKDKYIQVHFIDDEKFSYLLPDGCVKITDEEAESLTVKPNPIFQQIAELESTITVRRLREATLTTSGKSWLAARDAEIAELREQL